MAELDLKPYRERAKIAGNGRMLRELCDEVERLRKKLQAAQACVQYLKDTGKAYTTQCCDPVIDGQIGALVEENKSLKAQLAQIYTRWTELAPYLEPSLQWLADREAAASQRGAEEMRERCAGLVEELAISHESGAFGRGIHPAKVQALDDAALRIRVLAPRRISR